MELHNTLNHLNSLFSAIQKTKYNAIITYPNADPNHNKIIKFIDKNLKIKKIPYHKELRKRHIQAF